jgi:hypothetical protein
VGNTRRGSLDCLADATRMRLGRPGVPREGDDGRVDGRERGGVPGSENWEFQRIPAWLTRYRIERTTLTSSSSESSLSWI